jgi:RecB family exonuclease
MPPCSIYTRRVTPAFTEGALLVATLKYESKRPPRFRRDGRWVNLELSVDASGRADRLQELADLELEAIAVAGQHLRRGQDL